VELGRARTTAATRRSDRRTARVVGAGTRPRARGRARAGAQASSADQQQRPATSVAGPAMLAAMRSCPAAATSTTSLRACECLDRRALWRPAYGSPRCTSTVMRGPRRRSAASARRRRHGAGSSAPSTCGNPVHLLGFRRKPTRTMRYATHLGASPETQPPGPRVTAAWEARAIATRHCSGDSRWPRAGSFHDHERADSGDRLWEISDGR
jgi:hypothetical protein